MDGYMRNRVVNGSVCVCVCAFCAMEFAQRRGRFDLLVLFLLAISFGLCGVYFGLSSIEE